MFISLSWQIARANHPAGCRGKIAVLCRHHNGIRERPPANSGSGEEFPELFLQLAFLGFFRAPRVPRDGGSRRPACADTGSMPRPRTPRPAPQRRCGVAGEGLRGIGAVDVDHDLAAEDRTVRGRASRSLRQERRPDTSSSAVAFNRIERHHARLDDDRLRPGP